MEPRNESEIEGAQGGETAEVTISSSPNQSTPEGGDSSTATDAVQENSEAIESSGDQQQQQETSTSSVEPIDPVNNNNTTAATAPATTAPTAEAVDVETEKSNEFSVPVNETDNVPDTDPHPEEILAAPVISDLENSLAREQEQAPQHQSEQAQAPQNQQLQQKQTSQPAQQQQQAQPQHHRAHQSLQVHAPQQSLQVQAPQQSPQVHAPQPPARKEYAGATLIEHKRGYSDEYRQEERQREQYQYSQSHQQFSQPPHQSQSYYQHPPQSPPQYQMQQEYYDPNYYDYHQYYDEYGYPRQYEDQNQSYSNYDETDMSNLDEIDKVLAALDVDEPVDEIEEEESTPFAALPSVNGVLTSHAAQFWFPECRECTCCEGFKHGCKCCRGGVQMCVCVSQKTSSKSSETASLPSPASVSPAQAPQVRSNVVPPQASTIPPSKAAAAATTGKRLIVEAPSGPSTSASTGPSSRTLGIQAEYWFPECRECTCCQGFKHGCKCCNSGSRVCSCATGTSVPPVKSAGECSYFKRGNCSYGDSCKFRHTR